MTRLAARSTSPGVAAAVELMELTASVLELSHGLASATPPEGNVVFVKPRPPAASSLAEDLERAGHLLVVAESLSTALELIELLGPQVILFDVEPPDDVALAVLRAVRTLPSRASVTPAVMLGGGGDPARFAGFVTRHDRLLRKPYRNDDLLLEVDALAQRTPGFVTAYEDLRRDLETEGRARGVVEEHSIATLLALLEGVKVSGAFELKDRTRTARLDLLGGRPVGGSVQGARASVRAVVQAMLGFTTGYFSVRQPEALPAQSLRGLVVDAAWARDDARSAPREDAAARTPLVPPRPAFFRTPLALEEAPITRDRASPVPASGVRARP